MNKYFLAILFSVSLLPFSTSLLHAMEPSPPPSETTNTETTKTVENKEEEEKKGPIQRQSIAKQSSKSADGI